MNKLKVAFAVSMLLGVAGCSSTPDTTTESTTNAAVVEDSASVFEGTTQTHQEWVAQLVGVESLKIYSPENYRELTSAWKEAGEIYAEMQKDPKLATKDYSMFSSETYAEAYQEQIKIVSTQFTALNDLKQQADVILADAIAQMNYLDVLNAKAIYSSSYNTVSNLYQRLFGYVLENDLDRAQEKQVEFLAKGRELEIKIIKREYITPLQKELKTLRTEGFHRVAPVSFANADSEIKLAANIAQTNPRDRKAIEDAVADAKFEIEHVKQVTHQVRLLAAIEDDKFEESVLEIENKLLAISQAVDGSDFRNLVLREQAEKILDSVELMHRANQTDTLVKDLADLNKQVAAKDEELRAQEQSLLEAKETENSLKAQLEREVAHIKSLDELIVNLKAQIVALTTQQANPTAEATAEEAAVNADAEAQKVEGQPAEDAAPEAAPEAEVESAPVAPEAPVTEEAETTSEENIESA